MGAFLHSGEAITTMQMHYNELGTTLGRGGRGEHMFHTCSFLSFSSKDLGLCLRGFLASSSFYLTQRLQKIICQYLLCDPTNLCSQIFAQKVCFHIQQKMSTMLIYNTVILKINPINIKTCYRTGKWWCTHTWEILYSSKNNKLQIQAKMWINLINILSEKSGKNILYDSIFYTILKQSFWNSQ